MGSNVAYSTGTSTIGNVGVTAEFVKQKDRNDGASYLSQAGNNQSGHGATSDMFYGNPNPSAVPALGIYTQPSNGCGGAIASWDKINFNGSAEVGTLTFTFDEMVTDPILDLSGLGGNSVGGAYYYVEGYMYAVARGSFNSTDLELITDEILLEKVKDNSNLMIDGNKIKVKERNTAPRSEIPSGYYTTNDIYSDDGWLMSSARGPELVPAGTGSIVLKGTFKTVSFKLHHVATPYSAFPTNQYGTDPLYFWNSSWGPAYGDGVNGFNAINVEYLPFANGYETNRQNADLFRASLRLQKPSSIGDTVWNDLNGDGIQDPDEPGLDGVTVKLLDKNGNPVKDYNGNEVPDQITKYGGLYLFDNLVPGEYYVQVVTGEGQEITQKGKGEDGNKDSDVNPETGKTDIINLGVNTKLTDIDAGIVNVYKVTHEFVSGTPGRNLPQEVKDLLPEDQTGKKNGNEVTPTPPQETEIAVSGGKWVFKSYTQAKATIDNANEHFVGVWVFEEDLPKLSSIGDRVWNDLNGDGIQDLNEPGLDGVTVKLLDENGNPAKDADGKTVEEQITANGGKYLFDNLLEGKYIVQVVTGEGQEITQKGKGEDGNKDSDVNPETGKTGIIELGEDVNLTNIDAGIIVEYKVTHEFISGTPGKELPQEVKDLLPEDQTGKTNGMPVTPTAPDQTTVNATDGTWEFVSYNREDAIIDGADEHFVGKWIFKEALPAEEYKVTHEFISGTPGKELPKEVKDLLPEDQTGKKNSETVTPTIPTNTEIEVGDDTWVFVSYGRDSAEINNADEHFVGTWVVKGVTEGYNVIHKFVSGTPGKELPQEVKNLLPEDQIGKMNGDKVTPTEPGEITVKVSDGTWEFVSYDRGSAEINNANEIFTGKWIFVEDKGTSSIGDRVWLDADGNGIQDEAEEGIDGITVNLLDNGGNILATQVTKNGGMYKFENLKAGDYVVQVIPGENQGFTDKSKEQDNHGSDINSEGENVGKTDVITLDKDDHRTDIDAGIVDLYKITYEFKSGTDGKDLPEIITNLLPIDINNYKNGDEVTPKPLPPEKGTVEVEDGTWTFTSYDKESVVINNKDENFVGTWVFEKKQPESDKGSVYVKYITEDGTVLEAESAVKKDAPAGEAYETEQKTFEGYEFVKLEDGSAEVNGTVAGGKNLEVTYVYRKVEPEPAKGNVYVKYITEDGTVLEAESAVKENAPAGEAYTTEQKTFEGYEFVKMADESAPANGEVAGDQDLHVTYVYKPVTPKPDPDKGSVYVRYITEDGIVLEAESAVKTDAPGGEAYTTEQKKFAGYEFVKMADGSADASGSVVAGEGLHVTYIYKPINLEPEKGNVYVQYVTEDGTVLEAESAVKTNAPAGEEYTTEQKTFAGYEFVKMADDSAPANDQVNGDQNLLVTYVYKPVKTSNVYVKYITEDGIVLEAENAVKTNAPAGEEYTTEQKTFAGYEFVKMSDDSAPANGQVNEDQDLHVIYVYKPVTPETGQGSVYVKYVTEDGTVLEAESAVKTNAPAGEGYTTEQKIFVGYEFKEMATNSAPANGQIIGDQDLYVTYVYKPVTPAPQPETGSVYVRYITEEGVVLETESVVLKDAPDGEPYTTEEKTFAGYEFVKIEEGSAAANGEVVAGENLRVTYVYKPVETGVYVRYITEDGIVLEPERVVKENAPEGEEYTTLQKEFAGYKFVKMAEDSAPANGTVKAGGLHVTYVYAKTGNVYVEYITEDGQVLEVESPVKKDAPNGEKYTTEQKKFDGYEFVKMADNSAAVNGTVVAGEDLHIVYVYKTKEMQSDSTQSPVGTNTNGTSNPTQASQINQSPKTGENLNALLYVILLLASGIILTVVNIKVKNKKKGD